MENRLYPITQRRQRSSAAMRELVAGRHLSHRQFIQPLFVEEGLSTPRPVQGLAGIAVDTVESVLHTIESDLAAGINKFLIFPVPVTRADKPADFSFARLLTRRLREAFSSDIWVAMDLCLCSYTTHGHCGVLNDNGDQINNSASVDILTKYALQLAQEGVDCIAPSDMMDGRIGAIRQHLNAMGFDQVSLLSYAAKFSSQWYGPFRDACHSAPRGASLRDRKTYQLSPANAALALESALRDEAEGADMLMVKPAGQYADIIYRLRQQTSKPLLAYHVSGEYAAIEAMAAQGLLKKEDAHLELWTSLCRAGADSIISYAARHARSWIEQQAY